MIRIDVDNDIYLKEIELTDSEIIYKTIDSERKYLNEWLPFVEFTEDLSYTRNFVESYLNSDRVDLTCTIIYKEQFVGIIGLKDTDVDNFKTEIGYWLSESAQHQGIITKSCKALINYVFEEMNLHRIRITVATKNFKSQRVVERLGFKKEGIKLDGELHSRGFVDLVVYGLLRNEFEYNFVDEHTNMNYLH